MNVMEKHFKHHTDEQALDILKRSILAPADYADDETLGAIATQLMPKPKLKGRTFR